MKRWSKSIKFSLSIVMAVILSAAMMIPVLAAETTVQLPANLLTATRFLSLTYRNKGTNFKLDSSSGYYTGLYINNTFEKDNTFVITATIEVTYASLKNFFGNTMEILQLQNGQLSNLSTFSTIAGSSMTYTDNGNSRTYYITFNTSDIDSDTYDSLYFLTKSNITSSTEVTYNILEFSVYSTYDPTGTTLDDINIQINNVINNINNSNNKLDQIITNQESNNSEIIQVLNDIVLNQEIQNENWETIINYGSEYDQIDTTLINNLGSAEDQLSNAEDAIQNKSKSLVQRASSGVQKAVTASGQLVSSLTSTVPTVVSFATDIIEQTPEEIQAAVLAIPLLSFAAWLIGLKK